jgi:hypothetical protein
VIALLALGGVGLLGHFRWARPVAILACALLLSFAIAVVLLLVASSAYLSGIYGSLGRGLSFVTLFVAAVVVEAFALLPLFQLRFLLRASRA